jgi:sulfonate transport system substrate-binding protein
VKTRIGARKEAMGKSRGGIVGVVILAVTVALWAGPGAWAAEKVTVGVGGVGLMVYLPTMLAKAKGYFADEGLDVEILDIKGGGSQAASALIGGSVDFSANAIDHAIKAKTRGKDLVAVHSHVRLPVMGLVVANKYKGEIKSIVDLRGRPIGVTSPGSQTHMVLGYLLVKSGVKADEVKIIGAGGNTMPLAIEKDSVHAGMLVDPFFTVFLKQGKGFALVDLFTTKGTLDAMGGEVQGTTLLTRPDVIAKHPATVQKMVNALVRANKFIVGSSGEELATVLPKELAGDPKLYAESFAHSREAFPPDSLVTRDGVARVIETMRAFDAVPAGMKLEPESVFDNKFVMKALGR